jgi:hypothetical protein
MTKTFCDICGREMKHKDYRYSVTIKHENSALVDEDGYPICDCDFYLKDVCKDCKEDIYNFIGDLQYNKQH